MPFQAIPLPSMTDISIPGTWKEGNALQKGSLENRYYPLVQSADAASKIAYANLMGPQFLAKLFGNTDILANIPDDQKAVIMDRLKNAGLGGGTGASLFGTSSMNNTGFGNSGIGSSSNPLLDLGMSALSNIFSRMTGSQPTQSNPLANRNYSVPVNRQNINEPASINQDTESQYTNNNTEEPSTPNKEIGEATAAWMADPKVQEQAQKDGMYTFPDDDKLLAWYRGKQGQNQTSTEQPIASAEEPALPSVKNSSYAENAANYKSIIKEGEALGTQRGKDISDIGQQQLDLSNSGVILDRLVNITQNPEFQTMRNKIPFFQDKQLWYLSKNGTPEQQKAIGDLISTAQAFKASTVNSFKGKALEKEFNLADKIKIDENDTMGVIQGKLQSLMALKQIAEKKNDIILDLMQNKHMNLGEATKIANKMVDTKAIEKQVDNVLNPQPSENDIQHMMKLYNVPRDEIVKRLKAKGYKNVT